MFRFPQCTLWPNPLCSSPLEGWVGPTQRSRTGLLTFCSGLLILYLGSLTGCQVVISRAPVAHELPASGNRAAPAFPPPTVAAVAPTVAPTVLPPTPTPRPPTATPAPRAARVPPERIVAPAIGLDAAVVPIGWHTEEQNGKMVSVWDVASYAAGWHSNSVYPGQPGNVVLSGHHNIDGEVFRHVVDLNPGDRVTLYAAGSPYVYVVSARYVLPEKRASETQRQQNARWIGPTRDSRLTLVTCWPYTGNTHRVIVVTKLLGNAQL